MEIKADCEVRKPSYELLRPSEVDQNWSLAGLAIVRVPLLYGVVKGESLLCLLAFLAQNLA